VFTEYRDTQRWLYERPDRRRDPAERIAQLYGGQDQDERSTSSRCFQESPHVDPVRILLATDAASEGSTSSPLSRLLHWEIPVEPNRLEQRNGRIDRHASTHLRWMFSISSGRLGRREPARQPSGPGEQSMRIVADDTDTGASALEDELYFLYVAAKKVDQIREDLGQRGRGNRGPDRAEDARPSGPTGRAPT